MRGSDVQEEAALGGLVEEYRSVLGEQGRAGVWEDVEEQLSAQCGWTAEGSAAVARLARDYGAFVLRNALALAVALEIEDGALGL
ncbi:MAG: hypothetical protein IH624_04360 [Phycisphaerae bacterium]|nr:hypothetical protein [Phycisphaerae bacterium]